MKSEIAITPVALLSENFTHHLDHLAPIAGMLGVPLLVDDESTYRIGRECYPDVDIRLTKIDLAELAIQYNFFLLSTRYASKELRGAYEAMGMLDNPLAMQFCFCPHGQSDKGMVNPEIFSLHDQEMALLYGKRQLSQIELIKANVGRKIVVGNYRLSFYEERRTFYDQLVEEKIFSRFAKAQKTILYAPTWQDGESESSFFSEVDHLVEHLPSSYNLIIKLHPLLERHQPASVWRAIGLYGTLPHVQVLLDFPLIYPLLNRIDLYLGDYSAVGYDFLYFNRPMFFFGKEVVSLHSCGRRVADSQEFMRHMEEAQEILSATRRKLYQMSFENICEKSALASIITPYASRIS